MKTSKSWLLLAAFIISTISLFGQGKYFTRNGNISFNAGTSLEDIEAQNHKAASVLDASTGQIEFTVLIKAFEFKRALMQDHFNENYMESDKYPKASFKGTIVNNKEVNYTKDGTYPVQIKGDLTIHNETKSIEAPGTIEIKDNKVTAKSSLEVALEDYKIEIPAVVKDKINKTAKIMADMVYEPLK